MIDKEICERADAAFDKFNKAAAEMFPAGHDVPSHDKYVSGMEYVEAMREYADALEAWLKAMKSEFL